MKIKFFITFLIFAIALNYSCSSDDGNVLNNQSILAVVNTMNSGSWKITKYIDNGTNKTEDFSGYNFTFTENNILMVNKATDEIMGSWLVTSNSANGNNSDSDLDFIISFSGPEVFLVLTEDWQIKSSNSYTLELIDNNGSNGTNNYLTFERN
ncbi:hypothetical protein [Flavobacterium sp.]|uniref:hypothetical protein n=1 Tax=Flavobacterium sp. TaxID=239 RepID=UPI0026060F77|nr:hypothetical protein [Flavobacterium sp.]MDD3005349.1 hypothetical protein [Flavobacterium sp.]